jgi:hypothetical protein
MICIRQVEAWRPYAVTKETSNVTGDFGVVANVQSEHPLSNEEGAGFSLGDTGAFF